MAEPFRIVARRGLIILVPSAKMRKLKIGSVWGFGLREGQSWVIIFNDEDYQGPAPLVVAVCWGGGVSRFGTENPRMGGRNKISRRKLQCFSLKVEARARQNPPF